MLSKSSISLLLGSLVVLLLVHKPCLATQQTESESNQSEPAPEPYSFSFTSESDGGQTTRQEVGDASGRVTGFYMMFGDDGRERRVDYVADENGYRAQISTNEVGTRAESSADAQYSVRLPSEAQLAQAKTTADEYRFLEETHREQRERHLAQLEGNAQPQERQQQTVRRERSDSLAFQPNQSINQAQQSQQTSSNNEWLQRSQSDANAKQLNRSQANFKSSYERNNSGTTNSNWQPVAGSSSSSGQSRQSESWNRYSTNQQERTNRPQSSLLATDQTSATRGNSGQLVVGLGRLQNQQSNTQQVSTVALDQSSFGGQAQQDSAIQSQFLGQGQSQGPVNDFGQTSQQQSVVVDEGDSQEEQEVQTQANQATFVPTSPTTTTSQSSSSSAEVTGLVQVGGTASQQQSSTSEEGQSEQQEAQLGQSQTGRLPIEPQVVVNGQEIVQQTNLSAQTDLDWRKAPTWRPTSAPKKPSSVKQVVVEGNRRTPPPPSTTTTSTTTTTLAPTTTTEQQVDSETTSYSTSPQTSTTLRPVPIEPSYGSIKIAPQPEAPVIPSSPSPVVLTSSAPSTSRPVPQTTGDSLQVIELSSSTSQRPLPSPQPVPTQSTVSYESSSVPPNQPNRRPQIQTSLAGTKTRVSQYLYQMGELARGNVLQREGSRAPAGPVAGPNWSNTITARPISTNRFRIQQAGQTRVQSSGSVALSPSLSPTTTTTTTEQPTTTARPIIVKEQRQSGVDRQVYLSRTAPYGQKPQTTNSQSYRTQVSTSSVSSQQQAVPVPQQPRPQTNPSRQITSVERTKEQEGYEVSQWAGGVKGGRPGRPNKQFWLPQQQQQQQQQRQQQSSSSITTTRTGQQQQGSEYSTSGTSNGGTLSFGSRITGKK